jgi:misacylated tRNA(Ala) deacylase
MTTRMYLEDAYLKKSTARVVSVDEKIVELDCTVLYAESGGQAADHGWLRWSGEEARVVDVQYAPESVTDVVHTVDGPLPAVGDEVEVEVDWPRRYGLMRHHTLAHVLANVLFTQFDGVRFTGGQLYPDRARFDCEFDDWKPELRDEITTRVNATLEKDYPVRTYTLSREEFEAGDFIKTKENLVDPRIERVRITDIVGLDKQADGGTHVASTKEVGRFVIDKVDNKGKGHRRFKVHAEPPV